MLGSISSTIASLGSNFQISAGLFNRLCQIAVTLLGSTVSPTWQYFETIINPWMNVKALSQVSTALPEIFSFYEKASTHHDQISHQLLPQLLLCFISSVAFLILCKMLGGYIANQLTQTRFGEKWVMPNQKQQSA